METKGHTSDDKHTVTIIGDLASKYFKGVIGDVWYMRC